MTDLAQRAEQITRFMETHMIDGDGLVYATIRHQTLKPFRKEDIAGQDYYPYYYHTSIDNTTAINYEDTEMVTADYMDSQLLRYRSTGEAEALAIARRCYEALRRVIREGNTVARGILPKPYGGLRHVAKSRSFSIDQYTKVMLALERFREREATAKERADIARVLVDFAHWWCRQMFTPPFRELYAARIGQSWAPHNYGFKFYLTSLAWRLSRDPLYKHWLGVFLQDKNEIFKYRNPASANMADLAIRSLLRVRDLVPQEQRLWNRAIRHTWTLGKRALSRDYYQLPGHCIGQDTRYPHFLPGRTPFYGWSFERWISRMRYGASTALASAGLAAADIVKDRDLCLRILDRRGRDGYIMYLFDEDGRQIHHRHRFLREAICGYSNAAWLRAYWEAQQPDRL